MNDVMFIKALEKEYVKIKEEFQSVASENIYTKWPEEFLYNEGWNVFGLRFQKNDIKEAHLLCPVISGLIKKYDTLIDSLGFSSLNPGTIIKPHIGYTNKVLRCHMGIIVPKGDCALKVAERIIKWKEGSAFIFDDTEQHEAWNKTEQKRVVMLIDLVKDVLYDTSYKSDLKTTI